MPRTFTELNRAHDARIEEVLHLRATVQEARKWLTAALGFVEGRGPPNWDGIREFLKTTEKAHIVKLTEKQVQTLQILVDGERSAYPGMHLGTLNALALKGAVAARHELGSIFSPQNGIKWRITEAGRAALAAIVD